MASQSVHQAWNPLPLPHLHLLQHVPSFTTVLTHTATHANTPAPWTSVRLESHDQIPQLSRLLNLLHLRLLHFLFSLINFLFPSLKGNRKKLTSC